jgi:hypothetical protein
LLALFESLHFFVEFRPSGYSVAVDCVLAGGCVPFGCAAGATDTQPCGILAFEGAVVVEVEESWLAMARYTHSERSTSRPRPAAQHADAELRLFRQRPTEIEVGRFLAELDPALFLLDTSANTLAEELKEGTDSGSHPWVSQ